MVRGYHEKSPDNTTSWMFRSNNQAIVEMEAKMEKYERNKCFQLTLPKSEGVSKGLLEIEIQSDDERLDVRTFREIAIYQQEIYPLLQTDKGQYKAKDKVKLRILLLDHNLKPTPHLNTIDEIWVEDPRNRRIAQWKDTVCSIKLLSLFPISISFNIYSVLCIIHNSVILS